MNENSNEAALLYGLITIIFIILMIILLIKLWRYCDPIIEELERIEEGIEEEIEEEEIGERIEEEAGGFVYVS